MTPELWHRLKEVFDAALGLEDGERVSLLDRACAGDEEFRREVEALLASHDEASGFMDTPVMGGLLTERPRLVAGRRVGHFEIVSLLGEGGMGEVYLAHDSRLGRRVALKLLPPAHTYDPDRLRRFGREARTASALNHPNILTVYETGQFEGRHYIAAEHVEGETLRQRMFGGTVKISEVLDITTQIAAALGAAHEAGVVHRDVKPENVMVRRDGLVKVLDFGLAKLTEKNTPVDAEGATRPLVETKSGVVMGTPHYMSPEQAKGLEADGRTDLWSLGVVLYEMLAGRVPFAGETASHVIVSILEKEPPPLPAIAGGVPDEVGWVVTKALSKDREERYQTAKELLGDLRRVRQRLEHQAEVDRSTPPDAGGAPATTNGGRQSTTESSRESAAQTGETRGARTGSNLGRLVGMTALGRRRVATSLVLLLMVAGGITYWAYTNFNRLPSGRPGANDSAAGASRALKTAQVTSWPGLDIYPSLSPDGNSLAYSSDHGGSFEIYVKPLTPGAREIQLTSDGRQNFQPAWSPDGRMIAYCSKNRGGVWVVPALGGVARQVTESGSYPAWSPDGSLIAYQSSAVGDDLVAIGSGAALSSTIWVVPSAGGAAKQITQVGGPPGGHGSPSWSPDGKRIAFGSYDPAATEVWTVSASGDQSKRVTRGYDPVYSPDGGAIYYASFGKNATFGLSKIAISPSSGEPIGEPTEVASTGPARVKGLTISASGKKIAYGALTVTSNVWSTPVSPTSGEATGPPESLTRDTSYRKSTPNFSHDGRKIAYTVTRVGAWPDIWLMEADGRNQTQLTTDPGRDVDASWFPGGDKLAFVSSRQGRDTLWSYDLMSGREQPLLDVGQDITIARVSPDGKVIAFNSRKGGPTNIWAVPVEGGQPIQLTSDKETMGWPCWSPDGKLLAFQAKRGGDTHVMVMPSTGGPPTQLTSDRGQSWPHSWSPDGDKIAFAGWRDGIWNVWWVSRSSGVQRRVTNYSKVNAFVRYPAWSPGGDRIVFEYAETTGNVWLAELD